MVSLLVLTMLWAAPPSSLATPGLNVTGVDAQLAQPMTDHLAQAMAPIRVITPRDMSALLGMERQKQLLGCQSDSSACMAELGAALGVAGLLLGDLAQIGKTLQLNVRVIDTATAAPLASYSEQLDSLDDAVPALNRAATELKAQLRVAGEPVSPKRSIPRRFFWAPAGIGVVTAIAGTACLFAARGAYGTLTSQMPGSIGGDGTAADRAARLAGQGSTLQTVGWVLVGIASVAVVAALLTFVLGDAS